MEPISVPYAGFEVATMPPNSQGITALMALNVLSRLDWPMGMPMSADRIHAQVEAIKVAWSERDRCVADPARGLADPSVLLSDAHTAALASRLSADRARTFVPANPPGGGTVYLCAADGDGMLVSLIESNYMGFGSGVMGGSTGIMLQNRGFGFRLQEGHPNCIAPRKRPMHTIIPGMVSKGDRTVMSFGVMGGNMQAQGHVQMMQQLVDLGRNPQAAVDAPRFRVEAGPRVMLEAHTPQPVLDALLASGHRIEPQARDSLEFGAAQLIVKQEHGGYIAASDPRRDGQAVGY